ncbi:MAG: hypothetical protein EPO22_03150 [Dehalococcoidia bacterium]|nr:MAG: hypothetical protein EPO22_03150 [Dehalococcoidia bacterium]
MNVRFLGRNDRLARLAELYRAAEDGDAVRDIDPGLRAAFDADRQLIAELGDLASRSTPANPAIGRAGLLAAVAARNLESPGRTGQPSMIGRFLTGRGLALIATAGIFAGGAATVGASGGVGGAADHVSSILQAAHITSSSNDATATSVSGEAALSLESTGTPEPDATDTSVAGGREAPHGCTPTVEATVDTTTTPEATDTPAATTTASAEAHGNGPRNDDCDVRGIPTTNPNFEPAAEGTCENGQSAVKTTPSGIMVNVPCQALDHGGKEATPTPADGTVTPEATPSANDHGNGNGRGNGAGNGNPGGNSGDHSQAGDHRP